MNKTEIEKNIKNLLDIIEKKDCNRQGIKKTPVRVARMFNEIYSGYDKNPEECFESIFDSKNKEMVIIKDIDFYSMCEHHMVPFFGKIHIGYIPNGKVLGLSKFARLIEIYARRLQIQENLTEQITDAIMEYLKPDGCYVVIEAKHLCMIMRGVQKINSNTTTSSIRGVFLENTNTRLEFLSLINRK